MIGVKIKSKVRVNLPAQSRVRGEHACNVPMSVLFLLWLRQGRRKRHGPTLLGWIVALYTSLGPAGVSPVKLPLPLRLLPSKIFEKEHFVFGNNLFSSYTNTYKSTR